MVRAVERPLVPPTMARAAVEATRGDPLLYAATSLMLLAGLRPGEVLGLPTRDWQPGGDPKLTVRLGRSHRTIRVAESAAAAVEACRREVNPGEPLLFGLTLPEVRRLVYRDFGEAMRCAGLDLRKHDLRQTAVATVLEDGAPMMHVSAYFGLLERGEDKPLVPVPDGYDRRIVAVLEQTFAV